MTRLRRPLIIYVSGAPGSGKTTLASKLAAEFYIPHVSSDLVHGGIRLTEGAPNDRHKSLHEVFVPLLVDMAEKGISFVVDHVLQHDKSEADILAKLYPHASVIYVHTSARDPIGRHLTRELARTDRGRVLDEAGLIERSEYHRQNLPNTARPLQLEVPTIEVNTNDGYDPAFADIVAFIEREHRR